MLSVYYFNCTNEKLKLFGVRFIASVDDGGGDTGLIHTTTRRHISRYFVQITLLF